MSLHAHVEVRRPSLEVAIELRAEPGRTVALLGPNGAGKSTVLGALAGTVALSAGAVSVGERVLDDVAAGTHVPAPDRGMGLVPQDLLLFDHLDATDNVAFGLRARGMRRADARREGRRWLEQMELGEVADRRPPTLSGGQAQRVALARALAIEPEVLLLDEPLAALDAATRQRTRRDLRRWTTAFAGPTVLVTHDPVDALVLADDLVVLAEGRVVEAGPTAQVATRPRTPHVAALLGTNLLEGRARGTRITVDGATVVASDPLEGDVLVTIAPRALTVHRTEPAGSARNRWSMTVAAIDLLGDRVRVQAVGPPALTAEITPDALADLDLRVGEACWFAAKATEVVAYPR